MIFKFKSDKEKPMIGQIRIISSFCILPRFIDGHFIWLESIYIQQEFKSISSTNHDMMLEITEKWEDVKFSKDKIKVNFNDTNRLYYRTKS